MFQAFEKHARLGDDAGGGYAAVEDVREVRGWQE